MASLPAFPDRVLHWLVEFKCIQRRLNAGNKLKLAVAGSRRDVQTFCLNPGKNQRKCTSGLPTRDIVRDARRMSFSSDYANYMDSIM